MLSGKTDTVKAPVLIDQISGKIRIQHGSDSDDYVWHISTTDYRIKWKVSEERLIYALAKTMNEVIPPRIKVNIWRPMSDWDIQEYTFKAFDLQNEWSVTRKDIEKLTVKLFEVLNTLV